MRKIWHDDAWEEYIQWQTKDKRVMKKINTLLKDIDRHGYHGIGKPEPLRHQWQGFYSVRIDEKNRLIFRILGDVIEIAQCASHYDDK